MNNNAHKPIHPTGHSQSGTGLTKREYFAAMAMQGFMANTDNGEYYITETQLTKSFEAKAKYCIEMADELLKQLEQK